MATQRGWALQFPQGTYRDTKIVRELDDGARVIVTTKNGYVRIEFEDKEQA